MDTVNRYLSSRASHGNQPIVDTACRLFLGKALSDGISEILRSSSQADRWTAQFAAAFIDATGTRRSGHLKADPAIMEAMLQNAVTKLADLLKEELADRPEAVSWRSAMAERLRNNARPVFARAERPTPKKATAMRMTALRLAAEADGMKREDIGDQFRRVAAGITLLQHRATHERQDIEVVMLAAE